MVLYEYCRKSFKKVRHLDHLPEILQEKKVFQVGQMFKTSQQKNSDQSSHALPESLQEKKVFSLVARNPPRKESLST
jgi:hypothetical protein